MPLFRYDAIDGNGNIISGEMDVPSEAAVSIRLSQQGFSLLKISAQFNTSQKAVDSLATQSQGVAQPATASVQKTLIGASAGSLNSSVPSRPAKVLMGDAEEEEPVIAPVPNATSNNPNYNVQVSVLPQPQPPKYTPPAPVASSGSPKIVSNNKAMNALPVKPHSNVVQGEKRGPASSKVQALFFRQLAVLVRSGISIYDALDNLGPRTQHEGLRKTAIEMAAAARTGKSISSIMERYPDLFQFHVVGAVKAGEKGGFIDIVLDEIAYEYEQEMAFYKGFWFPMSLVITQAFAVCLAQPLFPTVFPNAQFMQYVKLVFLRNIPIGCLVMLGCWLYWKWMHIPQNDVRRDRLTLKIPVFANLSRQRSLAAFIRMLRKLYQAGVGPINAWEGAMNVAPNAVIRERLVHSYGLMQKNVPLHDAFTQTGLFANEMENLLATGMVAGQVVDMLDKIAEYYQANVDRAFSRAKYSMYHVALTTFLILIGFTICWMAYSYFAGIFNYVDTNFGS